MSLESRPDVSGIVGAPESSEQPADRRQWHRGLVTATAVGPPKTVTVDGRPMRYLSSYTAPANGDDVVWVRIGSMCICLGKLA